MSVTEVRKFLDEITQKGYHQDDLFYRLTFLLATTIDSLQNVAVRLENAEKSLIKLTAPPKPKPAPEPTPTPAPNPKPEEPKPDHQPEEPKQLSAAKSTRSKATKAD